MNVQDLKKLRYFINAVLRGHELSFGLLPSDPFGGLTDAQAVFLFQRPLMTYKPIIDSILNRVGEGPTADEFLDRIDLVIDRDVRDECAEETVPDRECMTE